MLALKRLLFTAAVLTLVIISVFAISATSTVRASPSASFNVKVKHAVDIRESGLLVINDTVTLSTNPGDILEPFQNYALGFPFRYQFALVDVFAYETASPSSRLTLELNAGIGRIGFYGVKVNFPAPVDISNGNSREFTVVFVFSESVSFSSFPLEETQVVFYNASFPSYPSLPNAVSEVDLSIILPITINYTRSSFENEGISFSNVTQDNSRIFTYVKSNLTEFSDHPAWVYASKTGGIIQLLDVKKVERKIEILSDEQIRVSDSYDTQNKAGTLSKVQLKLLKDAYAFSAIDEFGLVQETNLEVENTAAYTNVTITFTVPYEEGDNVRFSVQYNLPWLNYVTGSTLGEQDVSLSLYENFDWTIRQLSITFALPEGATLRSSIASPNLSSLQNTAFSSSFTLAYQNATPFQDYSFNFKYQRPAFWDSFRPTVWVSTFVLIVSAILGAWHVYRPSAAAPLPTAVIGIRAEDLRNFVSSYEEKRRLQREADSLENAARKGKIPRRQYKVRKMTIEGRITSLSRDLAALRDKLRTAGPRFQDLMRQLEVAETELQGAGAEINAAEIRYRRGDLSPQAYHNVLETAYRRRDRAQTTIDGVLLRLREEIS